MMIIHQAIGMTDPSEAIDDMRKDRKKCFSVGVVFVDDLLGISQDLILILVLL